MAALVLKAWKVNNRPVDENDNYVVIVGRRSGLVSWLLTLLGVDPTTTLRVGAERIEFHQSSLSGTSNRMIPLRGVCSTFYGYHKPWQQAAALIVIFLFVSIAIGKVLAESGSSDTGALIYIVGTLIGTVLAIVYYHLNRTLTLGFVENSGVINAIQFKRSVIEGIDVGEEQARLVCELTQAIIEQKVK